MGRRPRESDRALLRRSSTAEMRAPIRAIVTRISRRAANSNLQTGLRITHANI